MNKTLHLAALETKVARTIAGAYVYTDWRVPSAHVEITEQDRVELIELLGGTA